MKFNQQRGVALVITLIMLSVITFLAVAFLALSRRDKASVNVSLSQTDARFMADTARARAEAEIISRMIAKDTLLAYDLMVSRNYINPAGFIPGDASPLNVNYDYRNSGGTLNDNERIQNIGNLFYDPRPPVYIMTNQTGPADFRFYIDFDRDGRFTTNGLQLALGDDGQPLNPPVTINVVGDPEWIGLLEKPQYPHSGTNRIPGRYAYIVVPEGKTLDINFMHNYAKGNANPALFPNPMTQEGFLRNQGVGSWEINMAAFFQDLNTNMYELGAPYFYRTNVANVSDGNAFVDAHSILRYRYATNHASLRSAEQTLGNPASTEYPNDFIDGYSDGPLLYTDARLFVDNDNAARPWPGSRNTNSYRDIQELFDANKTSISFVNRLRGAMAQSNSYDSQTFSRLLSQLGTSSDTNNFYVVNGKSYPKIHLNYDNVTPNTDGFVSQTNFFQWEPITFFTNTAEALIRKSLIPLRDNNNILTNYYLGGVVSTNFNLTNIMIYPTNEYSPAVHRLLQLSANIYAATTNGFTTNVNSVNLTNLPFVFRPYFRQEGTNIFIAGYREETGTNIGPVFSSEQFAALAINREIQNTNIYGVPWVISAKKGMPNFNEFTYSLSGRVVRKMEVFKPFTNSPQADWSTNLLYQLSLTNYFATEFWNSYTQSFKGGVRVLLTNSYLAVLTNESGNILRQNAGHPLFTPGPTGLNKDLAIFGAPWPVAAIRGNIQNSSFLVMPLDLTNRVSVILPDAQYTNHTTTPSFWILGTNEASFQRGQGFYVPHWGYAITNRVFAAIIETNANRILDLVNFTDLRAHTNIWDLILQDDNGSPNNRRRYWRTNTFAGTLTRGMNHQMEVSLDHEDEPTWREALKKEQIEAFRYFVGLTPTPPPNYRPTNQMNAPFTPDWDFAITNSWQANDPLVHYMPQDLVAADTQTIGTMNARYSPWGGKRTPGKDPESDSGDPQIDYEIGLKDPLVRWSDDWDFPTNKFPSIGWLGRVHRGTPWQTVYMKADRGVNTNVWRNWSGDFDLSMYPTADWFLMDIFTTAPNDNAARGLLSINQTNFAAWSAVLSGVQVLTNSTPVGSLADGRYPTFAVTTIEPTSWQLSNIVHGINSARTNRPNQVFSSVAEVLATPELTIGTGTNGSPFLFLGNANDSPQLRHSLNDAAVERIPQQVLSLLKVGYPRFTVYSFGQALRPAQNSIVNSAPAGRRELLNLCTNYQITGEVVTRTVLRVEGTPQNPKAVVESFQILHED